MQDKDGDDDGPGTDGGGGVEFELELDYVMRKLHYSGSQQGSMHKHGI
jgi:hypothetical protein